MGDMNADGEKYNTKTNIKKNSKYRIIQLLEELNLVDTHKMTNQKNVIDKTWKRNGIPKTRIDQIWISENLINNLIITEIKDNQIISNETDHILLIMIIENINIFGTRSRAKEKRSNIKRKIYKLNEMTNQHWEYYREYMNNLLATSTIEEEFFTNDKNLNWFNRVWDKIEKVFKQTMNNTIPTKEVRKSEYSKKPKLMSDTYKANKWLIRIWRALQKEKLQNINKKKKDQFLDYIEKFLLKYNITEFNILEIREMIMNNRD